MNVYSLENPKTIIKQKTKGNEVSECEQFLYLVYEENVVCSIVYFTNSILLGEFNNIM